MTLPPTGSATDVSTQVLQSHLIYGGSDNTNPRGLSASKSLHYANGPSIQRPIQERVTVVPYTLHYQDSVGLFGAENCFVRVDLELQNYNGICLEEESWECAMIHDIADSALYWEQAVINTELDLEPFKNTYEPASTNNRIYANLATTLVSVDLINLKTGNIYVDDWLDVRLYTKDRQEHAYDRLYVGLQDYFYIGFHARNTRQLPYNVQVEIGAALTSLSRMKKDQRRFVPAGLQGNLSLANSSY